MPILEPLLAAVTATLVSLSAPVPAAPAPVSSTTCAVDAQAMVNRIQGLAQELAGAAGSDPRAADLGARISDRVRAALPTDLGSTTGGPPGTCANQVTTSTSGSGAATSGQALQAASAATGFVGQLLEAISAAGVALPTTSPTLPALPTSPTSPTSPTQPITSPLPTSPTSPTQPITSPLPTAPAGADSSDGHDSNGSGGQQNTTTGQTQRNSQTSQQQGSTQTSQQQGSTQTSQQQGNTQTSQQTSQQAPQGGATAAQLEQVLHELASTLRSSTDPAMQQLGGDLLGILGNVTQAVPLPGTQTNPTLPTLPGTQALPSVLPSGLTPLFTDDFESGNLGKWGTCQGAGFNGDCATAASDGIGVTQDPQRGKVAHFKVTDGKEAEVGGERSEVRDDNNPGTLVKEGDDRWYSWSMKFPENFPQPDGGWNIVMQWHQTASTGSPPLALDISKGALEIGGDGVGAARQKLGDIHRGEWVNYVLHVRFSKGDGFVEGWENGAQTVQHTARATMTDEANYLKMGIYRDPDATGDAEVLVDDFAILDGSGASASGTPNSVTGQTGTTTGTGTTNGTGTGTTSGTGTGTGTGTTSGNSNGDDSNNDNDSRGTDAGVDPAAAPAPAPADPAPAPADPAPVAPAADPMGPWQPLGPGGW